MEDPSRWDRLTAAIAVCDRHPAAVRWQFLSHLELVKDAVDGATRFAQIAEQVADADLIPGPSRAHQIAAGLRGEGLATERSRESDPHGEASLADWGRWAER